MKTDKQTTMCTNCGYLKDAPKMPDTNLDRWFKVFLFGAIATLLLVLAASVDAQVDNAPTCQGLPAWIVGEDMTALLLESYTATGDRRVELTELLHVDFARSPYNGFYDWNGAWVVLNKLEDSRYRIWAGLDWTIGEDYQLHNSTCMLYVSSGYEWYFSQFPKLWYPTGELYR